MHTNINFSGPCAGSDNTCWKYLLDTLAGYTCWQYLLVILACPQSSKISKILKNVKLFRNVQNVQSFIYFMIFGHNCSWPIHATVSFVFTNLFSL